MSHPRLTAQPATMADLDALWQLYDEVCAQQAHDPYGPRWTPGVYPARTDIEAHLQAGEQYAVWDGDTPVATMSLVMHDDPEYADVPWNTPCAPEDVAVIHLLAVHPRARGRQLGALLVRDAIALARDAHKRVMHLDVVPGNLAASRIYEREGFVLACTHEIYYEDTGRMNFDMYEHVL